MTRFLLVACILAMASACFQNNQGIPENLNNSATDSLGIINDPKNNLNIQTRSFSEIDSTGIVMFPLFMNESEHDDGSSLSYKKTTSGAAWNIIFLNGITNNYHLLSDKKMLIWNYNTRYNQGDVDLQSAGPYIYYIITTDDYNHDGRLSSEDPQYLFVSDKEGNHFRQISPSNYSVEEWKYIKPINKVIMTAKRDSDHNMKFDDRDEIASF